MKGMFTAGVVDFFIEKGLEFGEIIGVSAGAIHATSLLAKQKFRSRDITLTFINDKRYCSIRSLLRTGDLFNADFAYREIPKKYFPFDHDTFEQSRTKLFAVAARVEDGEPAYLRIRNLRGDGVEALRASASIPMISRNVAYRGKEYLDGGVSDSIPLKKIEKDGYKKNIVVLTKSPGYRKRQSKSYLAMKGRYKNSPKLVERVKNRHIEYNETMTYVEKREQEGRAFVIRPSTDDIKRIEKDTAKLGSLYDEGYATAKKLWPKLKRFIDNTA